jgi:hypothetical protein
MFRKNLKLVQSDWRTEVMYSDDVSEELAILF